MPIFKEIHNQGASIDRVTEPTLTSTSEIMRVSELNALATHPAYVGLEPTDRVLPIYFPEDSRSQANLSLRADFVDSGDTVESLTISIHIISPKINEVIKAIDSQGTVAGKLNLSASITGKRLTIVAQDTYADKALVSLRVMDSSHISRVSFTDIRNPVVPFRYYSPDQRAISRVGDVIPPPARGGSYYTTPLSSGVSEYEDRTSSSLNRASVRISEELDLIHGDRLRLHPEIAEIPVTQESLTSSSSVVNSTSGYDAECRLIHGDGHVVVALRGVTPASFLNSADYPKGQIVDQSAEPIVRVYSTSDAEMRARLNIRDEVSDFGEALDIRTWHVVDSDGLDYAGLTGLADQGDFNTLVEVNTVGFYKVDAVTLQLDAVVMPRDPDSLIKIDTHYYIVREWIGDDRLIIGEVALSKEALQSAASSKLKEIGSNGSLSFVRAPILHKGAWCVSKHTGYLSQDLSASTLKLRIPVISDINRGAAYVSGDSTSHELHEYVLRSKGPRAKSYGTPLVTDAEVYTYPMAGTRGDIGHLPEANPEDIDSLGIAKPTKVDNDELGEDRVPYIRQTRVPLTLSQPLLPSVNKLADVSAGGETTRAALNAVEAGSSLPESERKRYIRMLSSYVSESIGLVTVYKDRNIARLATLFGSESTLQDDVVGQFAFITNVGNVVITGQPSANLIEFKSLSPVPETRSQNVTGTLHLVSRSDVLGYGGSGSLPSLSMQSGFNNEAPTLRTSGQVTSDPLVHASHILDVNALNAFGNIEVSLAQVSIDGIDIACVSLIMEESRTTVYGELPLNLAARTLVENSGAFTSSENISYTRPVDFEIHPRTFNAHPVIISGSSCYSIVEADNVKIFIPVPAYLDHVPSAPNSLDDMSIYIHGYAARISASEVEAPSGLKTHDLQARELLVTTKANNLERTKFEVTNQDDPNGASASVNVVSEVNLDGRGSSVVQRALLSEAYVSGQAQTTSTQTNVSSFKISARDASGSGGSSIQLTSDAQTVVNSQSVNIDESLTTPTQRISRDAYSFINNDPQAYDGTSASDAKKVRVLTQQGAGDSVIDASVIEALIREIDEAKTREHRMLGLISALNSKSQYLHYSVESLLDAVKEARLVIETLMRVTSENDNNAQTFANPVGIHNGKGVLASYSYVDGITEYRFKPERRTADAIDYLGYSLSSDADPSPANLFHNIDNVSNGSDPTGIPPYDYTKHPTGVPYGLMVEDLIEASRELSNQIMSTELTVGVESIEPNAQIVGLDNPVTWDASAGVSGTWSGDHPSTVPFGSFAPFFDSGRVAEETNSVTWGTSKLYDITDKTNPEYFYGRPSSVPVQHTPKRPEHPDFGLRLLDHATQSALYSGLCIPIGHCADSPTVASTASGDVVTAVGDNAITLTTLLAGREYTSDLTLTNSTDGYNGLFYYDTTPTNSNYTVRMSVWWVGSYTGLDSRLPMHFTGDLSSVTNSHTLSKDFIIVHPTNDSTTKYILRTPHRLARDLKSAWGRLNVPFLNEADLLSRWGEAISTDVATSDLRTGSTLTINGVGYTVV